MHLHLVRATLLSKGRWCENATTQPVFRVVRQVGKPYDITTIMKLWRWVALWRLSFGKIANIEIFRTCSLPAGIARLILGSYGYRQPSQTPNILSDSVSTMNTVVPQFSWALKHLPSLVFFKCSAHQCDVSMQSTPYGSQIDHPVCKSRASPTFLVAVPWSHCGWVFPLHARRWCRSATIIIGKRPRQSVSWREYCLLNIMVHPRRLVRSGRFIYFGLWTIKSKIPSVCLSRH